MKNFAFGIGRALEVSHAKISKAAAVIVTGGLLCVANTNVQAVVFTSAVPITVSETNTGTPPGGSRTAGSPYPGTILVSGLQNALTSITVTLNGFNAIRPDDVDMLLVSPSGRTFLIFSDVGGLPDGGSISVSGLTITLSQAAASFLPDATALTSGTFKPTNESTQQDDFPLAGMAGGPPAGPYGNPGGPVAGSTGIGLTDQFRFSNPNGIWSLYIIDDARTGSVATPELSGITGWSLDIIAVPEPSTWLMVAGGLAVLLGIARARRGVGVATA